MKLIPTVGLGALIAFGCTSDYGKDGNATVTLIVRDINGGVPMDSDVRISTGSICPDGVTLTLNAVPKNFHATGQDTFGDIYVERYEVQYYRSDGRANQGVDVPYTISGNLTARVPLNGTADFSIEVVRRQAKVEPPLSQLVGGGGPAVVTMFAQVTFQGRTLGGQSTNAATGRLQIDFADFNDDKTTCPVVGG